MCNSTTNTAVTMFVCPVGVPGAVLTFMSPDVDLTLGQVSALLRLDPAEIYLCANLYDFICLHTSNNNSTSVSSTSVSVYCQSSGANNADSSSNV